VLPYVEQPVLDLGFYRLEAFPVLVGAALVVEFQLVMRRAPARGIARVAASSLLTWAIVLGILGAHLFDLVAYRPRDLIESPLALLEPWRGISSFGGMLGGLLGVYVVMRRRAMSRADMVRFADCLLFALPFTLAVGRLGCALQHDHPGVSSTHWLAVAFPDGPRFDLGLLEFFYVALLAGAFALLDRRRWPDGFYVGLFFAAYGPVRFALDSLRVSEARYLGWTPGQYLSLAGFAVGVSILWWVLRRPAAVSSP
jgi:phosphatidylglycerol:prolipoprotein diacylglycerol transferase